MLRRLALLVALIGGPGMACTKRPVSQTNTNSVTLGAYYFDGWSGLTQGHITQKLVDSFPEREPVWGWLTSQQPVVNAQIDAAADAGLHFFSFCWYYPQYYPYTQEHLNRALYFYQQAPNRQRLQFNILVVNHKGFIIGPKEWNTVSRYWLDLLKSPGYLQVNKKPLLSFFSAATLVEQFGSAEAVLQALDSLKQAARREGLPGISLAACVNPDPASIALAKQCGFDILTGYNYHAAGYQDNRMEVPIDSLITGSYRAWNRFAEAGLPYIPVATLNWDPRPWAAPHNQLGASPRYMGFSAESVYYTVKSVQHWLNTHTAAATPERVAVLYAWNEYGEGAWLTPSKQSETPLLNGLKRAVQEK